MEASMLNEQYEKWNRFAPLGLLVLGLGLSLTAHAVAAKSSGRSWFVQSLLGLLMFGFGIMLSGEAVKARTLYETELNKLKKD
jgi:hypothetical protein